MKLFSHLIVAALILLQNFLS